MIVSLPDFYSVNRLADMPAGRYVIVESVYAAPSPIQCTAILSEIVTAENSTPLAADLQIHLPDGRLMFRDFAVALDGGWRDSYGTKADSLAELLPPELLRFRLVCRDGTIVQHDGKGGLARINDKERSHGT